MGIVDKQTFMVGKHFHLYDKILVAHPYELDNGEEYILVYKQCSCGEVIKEKQVVIELV